MSRIFAMALAWAALLGGVSAAYSQERLSYKGVGLGQTMAEFQAKLPDYECAATSCIFTMTSCVSIRRAGTVEQCDERNSFGGARIDYGRAEFFDGKFGTLYLTAATRLLFTISQAAEARYGKPDDVSEEPFRTRAGATFQNVKKTWRRSGDSLILTMNAGKLGEGSAFLQSQEAAAKIEERSKSAVKKGAGDF